MRLPSRNWQKVRLPPNTNKKKWKHFLKSRNLRIEATRFVTTARMAEPPTDDQQLLRQIARGYEAAFAEIYNRHQGSIYRFVVHMTGSTATAEEVTQEVFMLLIRNPKSYTAEKGSLAAYLFGAARNLARRAKAQTSTDVPLDNVEENYLAQSADLDVLDKLGHSEALDFLRKALLGLPEAYREAVVLCDLEEMDYAHAAAILECSPGTVASRLHRAHTMLRVKLTRAKGNRSCLA
jgi:RNA polymerase sigma-70 factor (ECF subfamily)